MKRALRFLRNICLVVLAVGLCAAGAVAFQGYKLYTSALEEMPLYKRVEQVRQQPDFTSLESLPATYKDAVVAAEDHRFYTHGGIDLLAIGRAVWNDAVHPGKGFVPEGGRGVRGLGSGKPLQQG